MIVEKDCKYVQGETEYLEGQEAPKARTGDVYICGDYEYKYNYKASLLKDAPWIKNETQCGWGVRVIDKIKESYGNILCNINEKNVTSLHNTFYECTNITNAPIIPNTITDLWGTFSGCENLICSPIIPQSVIKMQWAFEYCEKLQSVPTIPAHITDLTGTFADCVSIKNAMINSNVKTPANRIFMNCHNILRNVNR